MVKFSFEVPIAYLEKFDKVNDYHFILAHILMNDNKYAQFYRKSSKFKILDNGAFELTKSINFKVLCDLAIDFKVDVLVLPDTLMSKDDTLKKSLQALDYIVKRDMISKLDVMFVPQGRTLVEFITCIHDFIIQAPLPETYLYSKVILGLPYMTCAKICSFISPKFPRRDDDATNARIYIIQKYKELRKFRIHLLGAGENMTQEISFMRHYPNVMSVDTSTPFILARNGIKLDKYGLYTRSSEQRLNFYEVFDECVLNLAIHNAKVIKRFGSI